MPIIRFHTIPFRSYQFTLGDDYEVISRWGRKTTCKFIKTTPKGFNLLQLHDSKCMFRHHIYDRTYSGRPIPGKVTTFNPTIPNWIARIDPIKKVETA